MADGAKRIFTFFEKITRSSQKLNCINYTILFIKDEVDLEIIRN